MTTTQIFPIEKKRGESTVGREERASESERHRERESRLYLWGRGVETERLLDIIRDGAHNEYGYLTCRINEVISVPIDLS